MASTNKTTNYELSQFIGTDKPTFLGDYNGDMAKIDAQMKVNADNITSATSTANTASTNASTALTNANTAQTTASTAQTTASGAQTTANNALAKALQNESDIAKFNLTDIENFDASKITVSSGTNYFANLQVVTNSDGSVGKVYGHIYFNGNANGAYSASIQTDLRPDTDLTIMCAGINYSSNLFTLVNVEIKTTGEVIIRSESLNNIRHNIFLFPCLYFMQDFGDNPNA